jgi:hypothetical protein
MIQPDLYGLSENSEIGFNVQCYYDSERIYLSYWSVILVAFRKNIITKKINKRSRLMLINYVIALFYCNYRLSIYENSRNISH